MDERLMRERVAAAPVARLATITPEHAPHVVPCCFAIEGDRVYSAVDEVKPKTGRRLARLANVETSGAAALLIDHYDDDWSHLWWIRLDCRASVAAPGSREAARGCHLLTAKYAQYAGTPPSGPVIVLDIRRWRAWP